jgi:hypothetical protein
MCMGVAARQIPVHAMTYALLLAAVTPTEFGSDCDLYANPTCIDAPYMHNFTAYLNAEGDAAAPLFKHAPIKTW